MARLNSWQFADSCKIPWHFQFFEKTAHPAHRKKMIQHNRKS